jgi:DNA-binding PadR family transcriptional regulator
MELTLSNLMVRRVLICLADMQQRSLTELVVEYNKKYPGFELMGEQVAKAILTFLVAEGYVECEVLSFTTEPIPQTKFYRLAALGLYELNRRR